MFCNRIKCPVAWEQISDFSWWWSLLFNKPDTLPLVAPLVLSLGIHLKHHLFPWSPLCHLFCLMYFPWSYLFISSVNSCLESINHITVGLTGFTVFNPVQLTHSYWIPIINHIRKNVGAVHFKKEMAEEGGVVILSQRLQLTLSSEGKNSVENRHFLQNLEATSLCQESSSGWIKSSG